MLFNQPKANDNVIKPTTGRSLWMEAWLRLKKNKGAMFGLYLIIILILIAIFAPFFATHNPNEIDLVNMLQGPSRAHWLGTDYYGRDLYSRIVYGARISLYVGIISQTISVSIGVIMGLLAGYYRGKVEMIIMRLVDIIMGFPGLLFIIAIRVALGPELHNIFIALGMVGWAGMARVIRSKVLSIRENSYLEAANAIGQSDFKIIFKHILPNALAPAIVSFTMGMAGAIMAEASLSFLGIGVPEPTPSWGSIINNGKDYLRTAPYYTGFPGLALALTVLGFNLFGDGLRDALDPKMKEK